MSFTEIYAQSLSADCDIDLWSNDMVLVHDTLFRHDDHLYQIPTCMTQTSFIEACAQSLRVDCDLNL